MQEVIGEYVRIRYEDFSDIVCVVPIDQIYYAQYPNQSWQMSTLPELIAGAMVDVLLTSETLPYYNGKLDNIRPKAWWPAILKKRQGDLLVVELLNLNATDNVDIKSDKLVPLRKEIVEIDLARFRCESIAFTKYPLKSFKIDIPEEIRKW